MLSGNVVCCNFSLKQQINFNLYANSKDEDQTAPDGTAPDGAV